MKFKRKTCLLCDKPLSTSMSASYCSHCSAINVEDMSCSLDKSRFCITDNQIFLVLGNIEFIINNNKSVVNNNVKFTYFGTATMSKQFCTISKDQTLDQIYNKIKKLMLFK